MHHQQSKTTRMETSPATKALTLGNQLGVCQIEPSLDALNATIKDDQGGSTDWRIGFPECRGDL
jgi:hypothetical protein